MWFCWVAGVRKQVQGFGFVASCGILGAVLRV